MRMVRCGNVAFGVPDGVPFACPDEYKPRKAKFPTYTSHWLKLHEFAADNAEGTAGLQEFFRSWLAKASSCGTCSESFSKYLKDNPPDFNNLLDWSIVAHNYVSTHHVKPPLPEIPLKQARRLWLGPKVAFLTTAFSSVGGTESFHYALLRRLRMRMRVLGLGCTGTQSGNPYELKVPFVYGEAECKKLVAKADVVVSWGIDNISAYKPKRLINVHHGDISSWWSNDILRKNKDDSVGVAVNEEVAEKLNLTYIPNAVDPDRCKPNKVKWPTVLSIQPGTKIAFWCARLSAEKRPEFALEIAKLLPPDWCLVMAGDGPSLKALQTQALKVPTARVIGPVKTPGPLLRFADCFLSTATMEGFGLSMAEAMYCNVPVISTPVGVALDSRIAHQMGTKASPADWAQQIVLNDRSKVEAAKAKCDSEWNVDTFVDRWEAVIRGVL
jgi:glycosyltransferase involved in cell wall biosynthesis